MKEKINLLDVIPFRNEKILTEKKGELIVLALPRFKKAWMQKYLLPGTLSPYIRVTLEAHGTAVWELINGERTVREIILELGEHFNFEENYDIRVSRFIVRMKKDGMIRYKVKC